MNGCGLDRVPRDRLGCAESCRKRNGEGFVMHITALKSWMPIVAIVALIGCFSLSACDGEGAASGSEGTASASASQAVEGFSSVAADDDSDADAADSETAAGEAGGFVGTWELYSMDDGEQEILAAEAPAGTVSSLAISLEVREDGTASYYMGGADLPGTWEATGADSIRIEFENQGGFDTVPLYDVEREGDMLSIEEDGLVMKLKRV